MKTKNVLLLVLSILSLVFFACSRNEATMNEKAKLIIALTDDPGNYDAVNIDVQDVQINYSADTGKGWNRLAGVQAGNYDILKLTNGREAILADAAINSGKIQQIRLLLGENNYVTIDGKRYPLSTPSARQSGIKLKINQEVTEGIAYKLLMDFDASRSIVRTGNGKYSLKPVIRTTLEAVGGSIRGYVVPGDFATNVYALQGTDTITGSSTFNGAYRLKGLNAGTYTVVFVPTNAAYKKQERVGVNVSVSQVTNVDTVRLTQ